MCIGKRGQGKEQLINMVMLAPKKLQLQGTFRKSFNILNIRLIRLLDYILDVHEMFMPLRSLKISLWIQKIMMDQLKKRLVMINIDQLLLVDY